MATPGIQHNGANFQDFPTKCCQYPGRERNRPQLRGGGDVMQGIPKSIKCSGYSVGEKTTVRCGWFVFNAG